MFKSRKLGSIDLIKKLTERGWKGRFISVPNETTYLSDTNDTIAVVTYDDHKSVIISAKFNR